MESENGNVKRRKSDAKRKQRAITVWLDEEQGEAIDQAAAICELPVSTWARAELVKLAKAAVRAKRGAP
jgi:uncharacterized protein (DUF1778 family)